jgi:hypothetical protein
MHHSHVDGVPVLRFADSGPLRGTLLFGAGARDETYRTRGVNRLVADLAVRETRRRLREAVGPVVSTGVAETRFTVSGTQKEVADCLGELCRVLGALPTDKLDEMPYTCDSETVAALDPAAAAALNARFGAQGLGLVGQECRGHRPVEHRPLTAEVLLGHAAAWFTRANAVLTLIGPDPVGLRLPLPTGVRPNRFAPRARYPRASWTHRNLAGLALSVEAPTGSAAMTVAHRILRERTSTAFARLQTPAVPTGAATVPHDSTTDIRLLFIPPLPTPEAAAPDADLSSEGTPDSEDSPLPGGAPTPEAAPTPDATPITPAQVEALAATMWSEALRLARSETAQDEVDRHRGGDAPEEARSLALEAAARAELFGAPDLDEDGRRALDGVTPQDVRDAWQQAMAGAQLVVPDGLLLDLAGPDGRRLWCTSCWTWDELPPWGETFREPLVKRVFRRAGDRHWTVLTDDAVVSCRTGAHHTLRFDDVVAMERHGPERVLIGRCGCDVGLDPSWYRGGKRLIRAVDEAVPAELAFDGV